MALHRGIAAAIVEVVRKDKTCQERIRSGFGVLPATAGIAGSARNVAMMVANAPMLWGAIAGLTGVMAGTVRGAQLIATEGRVSPVNWLPTQGQDPYICVGVAEATRDAIKAAIRRAAPGSSLGLIRDADQADRDSTTAHAATGVTMKDGKRYIFDWHCTLRIGDPMIFASQQDWDRTEGGVLFSMFNRFA